MTTIQQKRLEALEVAQRNAGEQLSDEERAERIEAILSAYPPDPRAARINELLDVARARRD